MDDMPRYSTELFAAVVLSTVARATILSVDATAATALPGVHSFVSAADLPGEWLVQGVWCDRVRV